MKPNMYAGRCVKCGFIVPPGKGTVERVKGRSIVQCDPVECGTYERYLDGVHPFSSEALGQD